MDEFLEPNLAFKRLYNEYKKYGSLTIGFDFDGTVHDYHKTGATYKMVIKLLNDLHSIGCKMVCWTAYKDLDYVREFLDKNGLQFCANINEGGIPLGWESKKPFFSALLDDRAGLAQVYAELELLVYIIKSEKNEKSIH